MVENYKYVAHNSSMTIYSLDEKCTIYHRLDGPAYENHSTNFKYWYYYGKLMNCSSQEGFEKLLKLKGFW